MAEVVIRRPLSSATDSVATFEQTGLVPKVYDFIALAYNVNGDVITAQYRTGGSSGIIVATLSVTYVGGFLATVTRL